ncbi:MAG TPA: hypothetical protein VKB38_21025 [Terracidiphilus sp.]|nr:hypothetical protein [Terracidiphilus sp.]
MRWLMVGLLVSVAALLIASAAIAHHIWREHRKLPVPPAEAEKPGKADAKLEEAP